MDSNQGVANHSFPSKLDNYLAIRQVTKKHFVTLREFGMTAISKFFLFYKLKGQRSSLF
jgi:hypothetical protein